MALTDREQIVITRAIYGEDVANKLEWAFNHQAQPGQRILEDDWNDDAIGRAEAKRIAQAHPLPAIEATTLSDWRSLVRDRRTASYDYEDLDAFNRASRRLDQFEAALVAGLIAGMAAAEMREAA